MNSKIKQSIIILITCVLIIKTTGTINAKQTLPRWQAPENLKATAFELAPGKGLFEAWGTGKDYRIFFEEFLPAFFERTIVLEKFQTKGNLQWIFTGKIGGFTVTIRPDEVGFSQRFYDSPGFEKNINGEKLRHPEQRTKPVKIPYKGKLRALTVTLDHKLGLSIALNGKKMLSKQCLLDVSRHQLRLTFNQEIVPDSSTKNLIAGKMLKPNPVPAVITVNPQKHYQTIMGFGGITTPTAYEQLSNKGKRKWWQLLAEYNLLIQREYPIGKRLNPQMNNWDRLEDATPHYYGDNFPNGEISSFEYIKKLRKLQGKVFFEFWKLPPWASKNVEKYADAIVNYCKTSQQKAGAPPDVVGIQNEVAQTPQTWRKMTLTLRKKLNQSGFNSVKIHMSDAGTLAGGIKRAKAFQTSQNLWQTIDYAATHMYDYQNFFTNPDSYDQILLKWKSLTGDKPFLSTELCINRNTYQWPTYRIAFLMGQLYHKNLVLADAVAICYCWTLLNVVQPSYGWTRALFVPDRNNGFVPAPSSNQVRVFGAFSRRIHEGMIRVETHTNANDLLLSAFAGKSNDATLVALNRSTNPKKLKVTWPGITFEEIELVDPYHQNEVRTYLLDSDNDHFELLAEPGAIITITNAHLGRLDEEIIKDVK